MIESIQSGIITMRRSELNQRLRVARLEQLQDVERLLALRETDKLDMLRIVQQKINSLKRQLGIRTINVKQED